MRISTLLPITILTALTACAAAGCRPGSELAGYGVHHYVFDATMKQSWAVFEDCEHPERPWKAVPRAWHDVAGQPAQAPDPGTKPRRVIGLPPAPFEIVAGSRIRVWKISGEARIDLGGVALESGAHGALIRVRTAFRNGEVLAGVVRGPASVELESGTSVGSWGGAR